MTENMEIGNEVDQLQSRSLEDVASCSSSILNSPEVNVVDSETFSDGVSTAVEDTAMESHEESAQVQGALHGKKFPRRLCGSERKRHEVA